MTDLDLGQMYLIYNKVLVSRSSKSVYFFKLVYDEEEEDRVWLLYRVIDVPGFISYTKGNVRMQLITEERVYFYMMDKETLEPSMENCMFNYMRCNQMIIGKLVRYCL
jgi:hypothetical protein